MNNVKYNTRILINGESVPAYGISYEFATKRERNFFASQVKDAIKTSEWERKIGRAGNKKIIWCLCVYTARKEGEYV